MKKSLFYSLLAAQLLGVSAAMAQVAPMTVEVGGIQNGQPIPDRFTYCKPDGSGKTQNSDNVNPSIRWTGAPAGTKSFALIVVDPDVPASFESANMNGKIIPENFGRQRFYHWVLVDIPLSVNFIAEGADSKGRSDKIPGKTAYGISGQNDYAVKANMGGAFGGYDGPCPPWNDERLHHYHFTVYALDVPSLGLTGTFSGAAAEGAMNGHIIARGEVVGTYSNFKPR